jgi:uncharacterized protein YdeI (YjbR/CyaY-like superfamily)
MEKAEIETFYPANQMEWRQWLEENHESRQSIWLVCYKAKTGIPTISWSNAVDEALCFGWIDSVRKTIDEERFIQFFSKRKPTSTWSKINKLKVEKLIADGLMSQAGMKCIEIAKQNGSWDILNTVDELLIPDDLETAFERHIGSKIYFENLSKSIRKMMLYWIISAKRPETRQKRIEEIAERAGEGKKPKNF